MNEREAAVITTKLRALGIEERVTAVHVCGRSHVVFVLSGKCRASSVDPVVPDLASALSTHRGAAVQMRLRMQPMAIEANHVAPSPLSWRNARMWIRPGHMLLGRSYSNAKPSDWLTSFDRHPHILIAGQTGSGKSNLLIGTLLSAAWNAAPKKRAMAHYRHED